MKSDSIKAAEFMDWQQVVLNGGPPCFHVDHDHGFCGRAQRWFGHDVSHKFVSMEDLIKDTRQQAIVDALEEAEEHLKTSSKFMSLKALSDPIERCADSVSKLRAAKMKEFGIQ